MTDKTSEISPEQKTIIFLRQKLAVVQYELHEALKAIDRHRREFSDPIFVKEFNREVTLDFDDPLYPYCPFRLTKSELLKYTKGGEKNNESTKT